MPPDPASPTIIEIRRGLDPADLPDGWGMEPIRWNGGDHQIGVDPRYQVLRVVGGDFVAAVDAARRACDTPHGSNAHEEALEDLEHDFTAAASSPAPRGMRAVAGAARRACDTPHGSNAHEEALEDLAFALEEHDRLHPPVDVEVLQRTGWTKAATDSTGQQLWVRPRAQAATAALDGLTAAVPPPPSVSIA